jgi:ATP-dependent Lon protease
MGKRTPFGGFEDYGRGAVQRCLDYALETRRRVKGQLKKSGGMKKT